MTAERCREWRESLGALALGQLPEEQRVALEAHVEGCAGCRTELQALQGVARLMPLADPGRFDSVPAPPASLADRVMAKIGAERRTERRRQWRLGLALSGATAAVAAALLAIFILPNGSESGPQRHVSFESLPGKVEIGATLEPHAFGTEIHVYVKGVRSGALCRVFLRDPSGRRMPAGSFRYRWGDDSNAILSSALDLSRTAAIGIRVGDRTFEAPVNPPAA